jgi:hypothetical protein
MFSFHRVNVKQDTYLQSSFQNDVSLVCINFVKRKKNQKDYNLILTYTVLIYVNDTTAATDYLHSVDELTN